MIKLSFHGAADTVTGSRYLLEAQSRKLLVDCGLFQGLKKLRLRNWTQFPVEPETIDAVVLTHAHLDHSGYLPALVRDGFQGRIHATRGTASLCGLLLPDSGYLQEGEAKRANRYGYSRHSPALPLYTRADAVDALDSFEEHSFRESYTAAGFSCRFGRAGHILGAATAELTQGSTTFVFSGDLGRYDDPLLLPPAPVGHADYLVVESTYGDRVHPISSSCEDLGEIVRRTASRGGVVVIPAFAVGRTQTLLHHLHQLRSQQKIPDIPIFVDSPMAAAATTLYSRATPEHKLTAQQCEAIFSIADVTASVEESKAIDRRIGPMIIISASGMATGGRILFHLERFAGDHRNTIVLAGYQAAGTRGDALANGVRDIKMHGRQVHFDAEVVQLHTLSAHADSNDIMRWLSGFSAAPRMTFVTHGDPRASDALRLRIQNELHWNVCVPEHGQTVPLE